MKEKKTFYKVPTRTEIPTSLPSKMKNTDGLEDIIGKDGLIQAKLEEDIIIQRLAKDIYKEPTAGLRELFNNEARQCRIAKSLGYDSRIEISINPMNRNIVIHGIDSMGMTKQVFKEVYVWIGRSDNFNGSESGQFGFGRIAYLGLSDIIVIETFARETNDKYAFLGKSAKTYEPMPSPELQEYGTRISLTIREGISMYALAKYLEKIARFTGVDVFLDVESTISKVENLDEHDRFESKQIDAGRYQIGPKSEKEFLKKEMNRDSDPYWIEINNEDYHLIGAFDGYGHYNVKKYSFLIGIPIEMETIPNPGLEAYFLNIKNERKYMPTASRDNLSEEAQTVLFSKIVEDVCAIFEKISVKTIKDYEDSTHKPIIDRLDSIPDQFDVFPHETKQFAAMQKQKITYYTWNNKDKIKESHPYKTVSDIISSTKEIYYSYNANDQKLNAVLENKKNAIIIVPQGHSPDRKYTISLLECFGIKNISDALQQLGIKFAREVSSRDSDDIVVHGCSHGRDSEHVGIDELTENDIKIPPHLDLKEYLGIFKCENFPSYRLLRDGKKITTGTTLGAFLENAKHSTYQTSKGSMTGAQLVKRVGPKQSRDYCSEHRAYECQKCHPKKIALVPQDHKHYDRLDLELCKQVLPKVSILVKDQNDEQLRLLLAFERCETLLEIDQEHEIGKILAKDLEIEYDGKWIDNLEFVAPTLKKLSKRMQQLYVECYDKLFKNSGSYGYHTSAAFSDHEEHVQQITDKLNTLFVNFDTKTLGLEEKQLMLACIKSIPEKEDSEDVLEQKIQKMQKHVKEFFAEKFGKLIKEISIEEKTKLLLEIYFKPLAEDVLLSAKPRKERWDDDQYTVVLCGPTSSITDEFLDQIREETDIRLKIQSASCQLADNKAVLTVILE